MGICQFKREQMTMVNIPEVFNTTPLVIPNLVEIKEFMRSHPDEGYAIPAFVGKNSNVVVLRFKTKKKGEQLLTLINPALLTTSGFIMSEERQFGVEGVYLVPRHVQVEVMYVSLPQGQAIRQKLVGKSALVFQQAFQALSGLFICDMGMRIDNNIEYQNASEEERVEMAKAFLDSLKEETEAAIEEDSKIKEYVKATQFVATKMDDSIQKEEILGDLIAAGKEASNGQEDVKVQTNKSDGE